MFHGTASASGAGRASKRLAAWLLLLAIAVAILPGCGGGGGPASSSPSTGPVQTSPDASGESFSFIVCGDPQNNYEVFDRVLAAARSVDFLIVAGDLTGSGTNTEFQTFVSRMAQSGVKYYAVPGNHDVATQPLSTGYEVFIGPAHQSFDWKNCHFILIDNCDETLGFYPAEQRWAREDLAVARGKKPQHIIAVAHVPPGYPYSSKASPSQIPGIDNNNEMVPLLADGGVEILFCGHLHSYMESEERGVEVIITGGAGAPLHGADSYHNYVQVDVNGRQMTHKVVRI